MLFCIIELVRKMEEFEKIVDMIRSNKEFEHRYDLFTQLKIKNAKEIEEKYRDNIEKIANEIKELFDAEVKHVPSTKACYDYLICDHEGLVFIVYRNNDYFICKVCISDPKSPELIVDNTMNIGV